MLIKVENLRGIKDECFVYDDSIRGYIEQIESCYRGINLCSMTSYDNMLLDSYSSAVLDGANTTLSSVKMAINDIDMSTESTLMVTNYISALDYIKARKMTEKVLLKSWNKLVFSICRNEYARSKRYRVSDILVKTHRPEIPSRIDDDMSLLLSYINSSREDAIIKACMVHFYILYIQPFCDGNGRIARILMSKVLQNEGYRNIFRIPLSKVTLTNKDNYLSTLRKSTVSDGSLIDVTPFLRFMLQMILDGINLLSLGGFSGYDLKLLKILLEFEIRYITVSRCIELLNVSNNTARQVLNRMVSRGILTREDSGKRYEYFLNPKQDIDLDMLCNSD